MIQICVIALSRIPLGMCLQQRGHHSSLRRVTYNKYHPV